MSRKILFANRHAPYGSSVARESLDAVLAGAAYDQDISLLFSDDAVFQLLKEQQGTAVDQKNLASLLPALALYDIEQVYVQASSLQQRGLGSDDLIIEARILDDAAMSELKANQDVILSF